MLGGSYYIENTLLILFFLQRICY